MTWSGKPLSACSGIPAGGLARCVQQLRGALGSLDQEIPHLSGPARASAEDFRRELLHGIRRLRNIALHEGVPPCHLETTSAFAGRTE